MTDLDNAADGVIEDTLAVGSVTPGNVAGGGGGGQLDSRILLLLLLILFVSRVSNQSVVLRK